MIKSIKWRNHEVLGNLQLDFTKSDGTLYNTIVLAGENGTGKTTILETLATFLNLGTMEPFESIQYEASGTMYTIETEPEKARETYHSRKNHSNGLVESIHNHFSLNAAKIKNDIEDIRSYGVVYSRARSGFNTKTVKSTTTQQLDEQKYEMDTNDDFTSIKQLLVDIDAQDNSEWMNLTENKSGVSFANFQKTSKTYRFKKAFNNFFETIKFKRINRNDSSEIKIIFEKNGSEISIDNLSTGEKQVVFRGTQLLKNVNNVSGGIVLIDEPELSMHPQWQQKVLQYYRNLFYNNAKQSVQMILATHSEYVLSAALQDSDNALVIVLKDDNGVIVERKITAPTVLPTITAAETNYLAFDIVSVDYHIQLYGYLQNKVNCHTVYECDQYILRSPLYDATKYAKTYQYVDARGRLNTYDTLPTYIRNAIDHPDAAHSYSAEELSLSIEFLIELCK